MTNNTPLADGIGAIAKTMGEAMTAVAHGKIPPASAAVVAPKPEVKRDTATVIAEHKAATLQIAAEPLTDNTPPHIAAAILSARQKAVKSGYIRIER